MLAESGISTQKWLEIQAKGQRQCLQKNVYQFPEIVTGFPVSLPQFPEIVSRFPDFPVSWHKQFIH